MIKQITLAILIIFISISSAFSQVPHKISYQGILTDIDGIALNGNYSIQFSLWDEETAGNLLWLEVQQVTVNNGNFDVYLGINNPIALQFDIQYWLEIVVNNSALPRVMLASSPYSFISKTVIDNAITSEKIAFGTIQASNLSQMGATFEQVLTWNGQMWQPQSFSINETDPIFSASPATGITSGNILNWNTAYSWGNHANAGYISTISVTENFIPKSTGSNLATSSIFDNGNIGIGTSSPSAKFHIYNGSVLFEGATGYTPISGAGTRMMWIPFKKAFRAGEAWSDEWDNSNIGNHSVAMGIGTKALGISSIAMGQFSSATYPTCIAMGNYAEATGTGAVAIGSDVKAQAYSSVAIGSYNIAAGNSSNWISTDPIFVIGNGLNESNRSNALIILKNSYTGINTDNPLCGFHLKNGSMLFEGVTGSTPISGAGTRMMWIPEKKAFRAGEAWTNEWDNSNIGNYSVAMGLGTKALGISSIAMGQFSSATYPTCIAMGNYAEATGTGAVAIGSDVKAQAYSSVAIGSYNIAAGNASNWISTDPIFVIGNGLNESNRSNAITVLKNGNTGINTDSPLCGFHVKNGSVLYEGTTGATPTSGAGTRMMWIPSKSALRAGLVTGDEWDDANIGFYSTAFGRKTISSGLQSVAMGYESTASGNSSVAMGSYTTASGGSSVAMGSYTTASGGSSIAMGLYTTASGGGSVAMGSYATASGITSVAMGLYTTAQAYASLVLGRYNLISGTTNTWTATEPVFVIGNGTSSTATSNAFTVNKNGNTGISRLPATNKLEVEGAASKTTAGDWLANSDRRIKTDILDIDNSIDLLMKLRPVKFRYTPEYIKLHPFIENKYYYNFIAQEYQTVFPESVKGSGELLNGTNQEILQIDTYNSQIITIKAVQELVKENERLNQKIDELQNELIQIKQLLQNIDSKK